MISSKHIKSLVASIGIHVALFTLAALVFMAIPGERTETGIINVSLVNNPTGSEFSRTIPIEAASEQKKISDPESKKSVKPTHIQLQSLESPDPRELTRFEEESTLTETNEKEDRPTLKTAALVKPAPRLEMSVAEIAPGPPKGIEVDVAYPEYGKNPKPQYPPIAKRRGYEGTVFLLVYVGVDGKPDSVEISSSSGFEVLDSVAVKAVRMWSFIPGKENGKPVGSWVKVPLSFRLNDGQGRGST